jgi:hypothetical protein
MVEIKRTHGLPENEFNDLPMDPTVGDYLVQLGGKRWHGAEYNHYRVYFNDEEITKLLNSEKKLHGCVYYNELTKTLVSSKRQDFRDNEVKLMKLLVENIKGIENDGNF